MLCRLLSFNNNQRNEMNIGKCNKVCKCTMAHALPLLPFFCQNLKILETINVGIVRQPSSTLQFWLSTAECFIITFVTQDIALLTQCKTFTAVAVFLPGYWLVSSKPVVQLLFNMYSIVRVVINTQIVRVKIWMLKVQHLVRFFLWNNSKIVGLGTVEPIDDPDGDITSSRIDQFVSPETNINV